MISDGSDVASSRRRAGYAPVAERTRRTRVPTDHQRFIYFSIISVERGLRIVMGTLLLGLR